MTAWHLALRPARTVRLRYEFANRQPTSTGVWMALCPTTPGQSVTSSEVALSGASGRLDSLTLEGNELLHVELASGGAAESRAATSLRVAGRDLRWGIDTMDGRLPYLPAYPRFTSPPVRGQDLLGRWRVAELGPAGVLVRARGVASVVMVAAAVAFGVALMIGPGWIGEIALIVLVVALVVWAGAAGGVGVLRRRRTATA